MRIARMCVPIRGATTAVLALLLCAAPGRCADPVSHQSKTVNGVKVNVVTVDLNDPAVAVDMALAAGFGSGEKRYTTESFASMVGRLKPLAAINGTFFDKHTFKPIGTIIIGGKTAHWAGRYTAMCFMEDGRIDFRPSDGDLWHDGDWTGVRTALCCGPTLVVDGQIYLKPRDEGFRDPHVFARAQRSALGITAQKKLLLVTSRGGATLEKWAGALKALGAVNAMNLDGGASSALYYRGKTLWSPGRKLTNILLIRRTNAAPAKTDPAPPKPKQAVTETNPVVAAAAHTPFSVREGEIRIDGTIAEVDAGNGQLTIHASSYELPNGKIAEIDPPKPKVTRLTQDTVLYVRGKLVKAIAPAILKVGTPITATGPNLGTGKPLTAREVAVWPGGGQE